MSQNPEENSFLAPVAIDESDDSEEDDEDKRTLFVCNIPERVTEELLYELFLQAGPIQTVNIPKEKDSKRQKSFGFVTYIHQVSVPYALNLYEGIKICNKSLIIRCRIQQKNRKNDSIQSNCSSLNNSVNLSPMQKFDQQAQLFDSQLLSRLGIEMPTIMPVNLSELMSPPPIENRTRDDSSHNRNRFKPYDRKQQSFNRHDNQKSYMNRRNDRFSDRRNNSFPDRRNNNYRQF